MNDLRYPTGKFTLPTRLAPADRPAAIADLEEAPALLRHAVHGLTDGQVDTPYRPDGWSVRQLVHHLPDSHFNGYMRLKLALTEEVPTIRPFDQDAWSTLPDTAVPIEVSLGLLDLIHVRWVYLWRRLSDADWERALYHPELGSMRVDELCALYVWHGKHHVAQIRGLRQRQGW